MIVTMGEMLEVARRNHFAVGAYNVGDSNLLRCVVEAARENRSPAIIAVHPRELAYVGEAFIDYANAVARDAPVPMVVHLDHGDSIATVMGAIRDGFGSVMIDGSRFSLQRNIDVTSEVAHYAHMAGMAVEGELGTIGDTGEDVEGGMTEVAYTDPAMAVRFVAETGVDSLAVAIGTCHGIYPAGMEPKLRLDILAELGRMVDVPLVLHGGSANPDGEIAEAVRLGISKVNISSDYKEAFFKVARVVLPQGGWNPHELFGGAVTAAKEVLAHKMELLGSTGQAALWR